jgi:hypothetical protein
MKGIHDEAYVRVQHLNFIANNRLMRLAEEQYKMFTSFNMDDDADGDEDARVDAVSILLRSAAGSSGEDNGSSMGGAAKGSVQGQKRSFPTISEDELPRKLRSSKGDVIQDVVQSQPYTVGNVEAAIKADVPALFDIDKIDHMKGIIMDTLKEDKTMYRTTSRAQATIKQVFQDTSGVKRIEEGVHEPVWEYGTGTAIFQSIFQTDSPMQKAWAEINYNGPTQPVEVMMISSDSTKILAPTYYGGVDTSQKDQIVPCHYDDIHNFTFGIYGTKTWLLARPDAVPCGAGRDKNLNRTIDCSSSIFRKAVLKPGQMLYIPKSWWHEVRV